MSAKIEQKELSHETILQSAARLLREKGIAGARVADVMKGAGLTVGGFYAHFTSKTELIDEALREHNTHARCGIFSVDLASGQTEELVVFRQPIREIYDVFLLPGTRLPRVLPLDQGLWHEDQTAAWQP